eukprot:TRINITY_DN18428_c0_g1_i1.p1 TRINITY_DN18428_c0_g1~~TRINITY_DN18428_c0_g1_i1.p1  ORF type:complete len:1073 (-),score=279.12 TRINITY_DN18428_c0_g1_i1:128-3346(-)
MGCCGSTLGKKLGEHDLQQLKQDLDNDDWGVKSKARLVLRSLTPQTIVANTDAVDMCCRHKDSFVRNVVLEKMSELDNKTLFASPLKWVYLLHQDQMGSVRRAALELLIRMDVKANLQAVRKSMQDRDRGVREMAVRAFVGLPPDTLATYIEDLKLLVNDSAHTVRTATLQSFRKMTHLQLVTHPDVIRGLLYDHDPEVRIETLLKIGQMGKSPFAIPKQAPQGNGEHSDLDDLEQFGEIERLLDDEDRHVRETAKEVLTVLEQALGHAKRQRVEGLVQLLTSEEEHVRLTSMRQIVLVGGPTVLQEYADPIKKLMDDDVPAVRRAAAMALGDLDMDFLAGRPDISEKLLTYEDPQVRLSMVALLGQLEPRRFNAQVEMLTKVMKTDSFIKVRQAVGQAMLQADHSAFEECPEVVRILLQDSELGLQEPAVDLLESLDLFLAKNYLEDINKLARHLNPKLRRAVWVLVKLDDKTLNDRCEEFMQLLDDERAPDVRQAGLALLRKFDPAVSKKHAGRVISLLMDSEPAVRQEAMTYFDCFTVKDLDNDPAVLGTLRGRVADTDKIVRARACKFICKPDMKAMMLHSTDIDGNSPLHLAAQQGHADSCRQLMEAGADFKKANGKGQSPEDVSKGKATDFFVSLRRVDVFHSGSGDAIKEAMRDVREVVHVDWYAVPALVDGFDLGCLHSVLKVRVRGRESMEGDHHDYVVEKARVSNIKEDMEKFKNGVLISNWSEVSHAMPSAPLLSADASSLTMRELRDLAVNLGQFDMALCNSHHTAHELFNTSVVSDAVVPDMPPELVAAMKRATELQGSQATASLLTPSTMDDLPNSDELKGVDTSSAEGTPPSQQSPTGGAMPAEMLNEVAEMVAQWAAEFQTQWNADMGEARMLALAEAPAIVLSTPTYGPSASGSFDAPNLDTLMQVRYQQPQQLFCYDFAASKDAFEEDRPIFEQLQPFFEEWHQQKAQPQSNTQALEMQIVEMLRQTMWWHIYCGQVKAIVSCALLHHGVARIVCFRGGPMSAVEQFELPKLVGAVKGEMFDRQAETNFEFYNSVAEFLGSGPTPPQDDFHDAL